MPLTKKEISALADRLWDARVKAQSCAAATASYPAITIEEAYRASSLNFSRRRTEAKATSVGRKIGLTSAAVQKQLAVDQPDFGYLTSDMAVKHGGAIKPGQLIQAKVEGEVAFALKSPLRGPGVTRRQVLEATDYVCACIEIIDSRIKDWNIKIQDTIADNASSALFVLSPQRRRLAAVDLPSANMTLRIDGELKSYGQGAACLGDPVLAVMWLTDALGRRGQSLQAGDIILSGAFGPVVPLDGGNRCEVEISGLGSASCFYGHR